MSECEVCDCVRVCLSREGLRFSCHFFFVQLSKNLQVVDRITYLSMLTCFIAVAVIMYVLLPMPLLFFAGSNGSSLLSESDNR